MANPATKPETGPSTVPGTDSDPDLGAMAGRLPPALVALAVHLPAWGLLLPLVIVADRMQLSLPAYGLCLMEGVIAWSLSRWLPLPGWWRAINLGFFPVVCLAVDVRIDPLWYLIGFVVLGLTSLGAVGHRVPLFLSSRRAMEEIGRRLPSGRATAFVDLGAGLGGPLAHLARLRPDARCHGVETAPLNWLVSRLRLAGRARVRLGSLWDEDLGRYDVVYAYLSPAPMERLWHKARQEMRPGSRFISNSFAVPGQSPHETVELHDLSHSRLLIWHM
jgi:hypothetical protein